MLYLPFVQVHGVCEKHISILLSSKTHTGSLWSEHRVSYLSVTPGACFGGIKALLKAQCRCGHSAEHRIQTADLLSQAQRTDPLTHSHWNYFICSIFTSNKFSCSQRNGRWGWYPTKVWRVCRWKNIAALIRNSSCNISVQPSCFSFVSVLQCYDCTLFLSSPMAG